ncbi:unnamed protein product [Nesidiocoris tenuis]|uniref:Uncharacterized protein n=1 Tax=Nesidiocoris tenuis TaxID=355587 RepID=A0A6H5H6D2_9HEMI|nr:unnamed protein product [Nesidiocoris tenuis]
MLILTTRRTVGRSVAFNIIKASDRAGRIINQTGGAGFSPDNRSCPGSALPPSRRGSELVRTCRDSSLYFTCSLGRQLNPWVVHSNDRNTLPFPAFSNELIVLSIIGEPGESLNKSVGTLHSDSYTRPSLLSRLNLKVRILPERKFFHGPCFDLNHA